MRWMEERMCCWLFLTVVVVLGHHPPLALPHKWVKHPLENPILFNYFAKQTQLSSRILPRNCLQNWKLCFNYFVKRARENTKTFYPFFIVVGKLTMKWQNTFLLWNTDCKRVVWGLTVEVKMGGYYHYIGPLWWYQRGWHGHNCTCHNWPLSAPTHLTLSSSMSSLTLLVTVATKIAAS